MCGILASIHLLRPIQPHGSPTLLKRTPLEAAKAQFFFPRSIKSSLHTEFQFVTVNMPVAARPISHSSLYFGNQVLTKVSPHCDNLRCQTVSNKGRSRDVER